MTDQPHDADADVQAAPLSLLDELQGAFAAPLQDQRLPARGQPLAAEYRLLELDEAMEALSARENLGQAQDVLIKALEQIHVHSPTDERADERGLVPLHVALGREDLGPLGFDHRLCEVLGLEPIDARSLVLLLFDTNEIAIGSQATQLGEWSEDTRQEHFQDFAPGS